MMTKTESERLIVISDLHLGNPFSRKRFQAISFLKWAAAEKYDICINGDGLEIAQTSFTKLAREIPEVIRTIKEIGRSGGKLYYVVGNHDMALEHFLEDWGMLKVCPFLNVNSGNKRIHIEHGHLYDPFFVNYPVLYEFLTKLGGVALAIHPGLYKLWIYFEKFKAYLRAQRTGIVGEPREFAIAADEICSRGFDAVIFGHTHHRGKLELADGKMYLNSGSWLLSCDYIEINRGEIYLKVWEN